jgi:hypothetical protein
MQRKSKEILSVEVRESVHRKNSNLIYNIIGKIFYNRHVIENV